MKKIVVWILAAAMLLALVGCSSDASGTGGSETTGAASGGSVADQVTKAIDENGGADMTGKKVGFSALMMSSEFFTDMSNQMQDYFEERGMEYDVADANNSAETQLQSVENFITMGKDYIILFVVDDSSIIDTLASAREQGVFIIAIGTVLSDPDAYDVCISIDQNESGLVEAQMAAAWIEETFPDAEDKSIEVAILYNEDNEDAINRSNGLKEIENYTSKAVVVETYITTQEEGVTKAQEATEMLLMNHPDIKCILTYGTDQGSGADEIALKSSSIDRDEFAIFTVDTPEYIREKVVLSATNESLIRGTVMLGEGTPMTCYYLMDGSWMDRVEDGVYSERCIEITPDTIDEYFSE